MVATTVGVTFRLTEFAVRNFNRIDSAMGRLERKAKTGADAFSTLNVSLTATASVAGIALGAAAAKATSLEDALARLETVTRSTSQTTQFALANAEESARSFAEKYTASTTDVIKAQFELATAGVAVNEQVAAVQQSFLLAQATMGDFTQAAQLVGQLLNTFGKNQELGFLDAFSKTERIADALSQTVQRFQVTLPVLQEGLKFVVGPAQELGLGLNEVVTALGALNTAGFRGTLAGTALSNMFNKLQRAIDKLDLDKTKFIDPEGNLESMAKFLDEVASSMADLSPLERLLKLIEVFDIRAGRVISTLLAERDAIRAVTAETKLQSGATKQMADIIQTTTSSQLKKMVNTLDNIATSIGSVLNERIKEFVTHISTMLGKIADWVSENKELTANLGLLATTLIAIQPILFLSGSVWKGLSAIWRGLSGAAIALWRSMGSLTNRLRAFKVHLAGIGTLGPGVLKFYFQWFVVLSRIARLMGVLGIASSVITVVWAVIRKRLEELNEASAKHEVWLDGLNKNYTHAAARANALADALQSIVDMKKANRGLPDIVPFGLDRFDVERAMAEMQFKGTGLGTSFIDQRTEEIKRLAAALRSTIPDLREAAKGEVLVAAAKANAAAIESVTRAALGNNQELMDSFNNLITLSIKRDAAINKIADVRRTVPNRAIPSPIKNAPPTFVDSDALVLAKKALDKFNNQMVDAVIASRKRVMAGRNEELKVIFRKFMAAGIDEDTISEDIRASFAKGGENAHLVDELSIAVNGLGNSIQLAGNKGDKAFALYEGALSSFDQLNVAFKNGQEAAEGFGTEMGTSADVLKKMEDNLEKINKQIMWQKENLPKILKALQDQAQVEQTLFGNVSQGLQDRIKTIEKLMGDEFENLRKRLALRAQHSEHSFFEIIAGRSLTGNEVNEISKRATAFKQVFMDAMAGKGDLSVGDAIAKSFKAEQLSIIADKAAKVLSSSLQGAGDKAGAAMGEALGKSAEAVFKKHLTIIQEMQRTGDPGLGDFINQILGDAGLPTFDKVKGKLSDIQKLLNDIFVTMNTADAGSFNLLGELNRILSRDLSSQSGLNAALKSALDIQQQAVGTGAERHAESAVKALLEAGAQAGGLTNNLTRLTRTAASDTEATINRVDTIADKIGEGMKAGAQLFSDAADKISSIFTASSVQQNERTLKVEVNTPGGQTIQIQVNGTGSDGATLSEEEIREIIEKAQMIKEQRLREEIRSMDEQLRQQIQLRG